MSFKERIRRALLRADAQDMAVIDERLCQQRDELLEAFKRSKWMNITPEDWLFIQDLIKKAEAAE